MKHDHSIISAVDVHPVIRRLTEIRLAWGLSAKYMGEKIGCSATTFNHMESGRRNPGFKVLVRWAATLGYQLSLRPKGYL